MQRVNCGASEGCNVVRYAYVIQATKLLIGFLQSSNLLACIFLHTNILLFLHPPFCEDLIIDELVQPMIVPKTQNG